MTALVSQGLAAIFDTLADAIEGGNTWRGSGTAFKGIAGQYSNDKELPLTITATNGSTTTAEDTTRTWPTGRWAQSKAPPYFLLAATGTAANVGQHRKVTTWENTTVENADPAGYIQMVADAGSTPGSTLTAVAIDGATGADLNGRTITVEDDSGNTVTLTLGTAYTDGPPAAVWSDAVLVTALPAAMKAPLVDSPGDPLSGYAFLDWSYPRQRFTVGTAFSGSVAANDTFSLLQGFKRVPNGIDIETDEGSADGFDRSFHLSADAGKRTEWSGSGDWLFETQLKLRVRFLKFGRLHDWIDSAMTNMAILRAGLAKTSHYETTYMRALIPDGAVDVVREDNNKIVVVDTFRMLYRLDTTFA